jgi:hypothetical protein
MSNLSVVSHTLAAKLLELIAAMPTESHAALNAKHKEFEKAVEVAKAAIAKAHKDVKIPKVCGMCGDRFEVRVENAEDGWCMNCRCPSETE